MVKNVTTSTPTPTTDENEDNSEIYLLIITIEVGLILLYKIIRMCNKGYRYHNETIISKHESVIPRS